ncbi:MAG: class I SAM-dependent methyltransferase [Desmonostoc vinosum HA7617-LM4]|jgi:type I restriction-modification system DNA methylase subunit|nr:class I SAM-dependent methyltransferase [Desmonostoc vinosum HA7617-LM4]
MFGTTTEFYPTPALVIKQMLAPFIKTYKNKWNSEDEFFSFKGKTILDPSAGAGDILDYLQEKFKMQRCSMFAIELDSDLRYTLQGKNYRVIGTDFLEYDEPCRFDLILMNPPFSNGVHHVIKAWEVLEDGGNLVALLNSQSLKNPNSKTKEYLLHLLATMIGKTFNAGKDLVDDLLLELLDNGVIEWLGSCFQN